MSHIVHENDMKFFVNLEDQSVGFEINLTKIAVKEITFRRPAVSGKYFELGNNFINTA